MNSLLARALESENVTTPDSTEKTIVIKGPLSDVYTKALSIAYAKTEPNPEATEVATESQQMDVVMFEKLAAQMKLNSDVPPTHHFQTVYGVSRDNVTQDVVVDITQEVVNQPERGDFYLIIDGTKPGANSETVSAPEETVRMIAAVECIVESYGGKVFSSLEEFAKSR